MKGPVARLTRYLRYRTLLDFPTRREAAFFRILNHLNGERRRWLARGSDRDPGLGNYFEFGVWNGDSLLILWKVLKLMDLDKEADFRLYGFDSFEGLPAPQGEADHHPMVAAGSFNSQGADYVADRLQKAGCPRDKVHLVPGFFESSLTEGIKEELGRPRATFVNVDVDYYSSTSQALFWIESLLVDGSIVFFDDILFYHGNPHKGQPKAIAEFNAASAYRGLTEVRALDPVGRAYMFWRSQDSESEALTF